MRRMGTIDVRGLAMHEVCDMEMPVLVVVAILNVDRGDTEDELVVVLELMVGAEALLRQRPGADAAGNQLVLVCAVDVRQAGYGRLAYVWCKGSKLIDGE